MDTCDLTAIRYWAEKLINPGETKKFIPTAGTDSHEIRYLLTRYWPDRVYELTRDEHDVMTLKRIS